MAVSLMLSWREGIAVSAGEAGSLSIEGPDVRVVLRRPNAAIAAALGRLVPPGEDEERLADGVLAAEGAEALPGWYYCVQGLARRGLVVRAVQLDGRRLATWVPCSPYATLARGAVAPERSCVLSRFAYLRRVGATLVLESPRALARIVLDDVRAAALVGVLATPGTAAELAGRVGSLPPDAVSALLALMAGAGMVEEVGADGRDANESALQTWEFHDLLFHARSRKGRSDAPSGATYRFAGQSAPPPAIKADVDGESVALERPDLERLAREDPPLSQVLEARRSLRDYGPRPIAVHQLGEFLYRVARVTGSREIEVETPRGPLLMEFAYRPYPSGGALYELEFYLAINACEGLDPGLYHYEARPHRLARVCGRTAEVEHLLRDAASSAGIAPEGLQVLVILSARFSRLAWKYESIAYSLILKHVGVAYQTMYLTATAMDLAPCALGGGDSDRFARAAGTAYHDETSVGEFLLGSKARPEPPEA